MPTPMPAPQLIRAPWLPPAHPFPRSSSTVCSVYIPCARFVSSKDILPFSFTDTPQNPTLFCRSMVGPLNKYTAVQINHRFHFHPSKLSLLINNPSEDLLYTRMVYNRKCLRMYACTCNLKGYNFKCLCTYAHTCVTIPAL